MRLENKENSSEIESNEKRITEIDSSLEVLPTPEIDLLSVASLTTNLSLDGAINED